MKPRLHPRDRITMAPDRSTRSQVDYILAGGFVPGLILTVLFFVYILLLTMIKPEMGPALSREERQAVSGGKLLKMLATHMVPPILLMIAVLGTIWTGVATATEASGVGALMALILMIPGDKVLTIGEDTIVVAAGATMRPEMMAEIGNAPAV